MADFTLIELDLNTSTQGSPSYTHITSAAGMEVRFSDLSTQKSTASASWPAMIRPAAVGAVSYTYAFTADATGSGVIDAGSGVPTAFTKANYKWAKWNWDNTGTFASAPIFTAYKSTSHDSASAGDGTILGGHATDSSSKSYLKGNAFGRVDSAGAPAAAPGAEPAVTDGSTGSLAPTAGANWLTNFQSLNGDTQYITAPFTPAATTADTWSIMFALFVGPNMTPATYTLVISLKYTWS
jgi:hypothetical protein